MGGFSRDRADNWPAYTTMPALVGYITKRTAIEMMYRPPELVGIQALDIRQMQPMTPSSTKACRVPPSNKTSGNSSPVAAAVGFLVGGLQVLLALH